MQPLEEIKFSGSLPHEENSDDSKYSVELNAQAHHVPSPLAKELSSNKGQQARVQKNTPAKYSKLSIVALCFFGAACIVSGGFVGLFAYLTIIELTLVIALSAIVAPELIGFISLFITGVRYKRGWFVKESVSSKQAIVKNKDTIATKADPPLSTDDIKDSSEYRLSNYCALSNDTKTYILTISNTSIESVRTNYLWHLKKIAALYKDAVIGLGAETVWIKVIFNDNEDRGTAHMRKFIRELVLATLNDKRLFQENGGFFYPHCGNASLKEQLYAIELYQAFGALMAMAFYSKAQNQDALLAQALQSNELYRNIIHENGNNFVASDYTFTLGVIFPKSLFQQIDKINTLQLKSVDDCKQLNISSKAQLCLSLYSSKENDIFHKIATILGKNNLNGQDQQTLFDYECSMDTIFDEDKKVNFRKIFNTQCKQWDQYRKTKIDELINSKQATLMGLIAMASSMESIRCKLDYKGYRAQDSVTKENMCTLTSEQKRSKIQGTLIVTQVQQAIVLKCGVEKTDYINDQLQWLDKYIGQLDKNGLKQFLKGTTENESLTPDQKIIVVSFDPESTNYEMKISACHKTIQLPTTKPKKHAEIYSENTTNEEAFLEDLKAALTATISEYKVRR